MSAPNPQEQELAKETHEFIRFMLRDHAFDEEFLVTAIQEYFRRNSPSTPITSAQLCQSEAPEDYIFCTMALGHAGPCSWEKSA